MATDWSTPERDELPPDILRELRREPRVNPGTLDRVMDAIHGTATLEPPTLGSRRWKSPRWELRLTAVHALAATLLLAVLLGGAVATGMRLATNPSGSSAPLAGATPGSATDQVVQFVFVSGDASRVTLVGDFNDWDPAATPLRRVSNDGIWSVVVPLTPGRYTYAFVVDGERWLPDETAPRAPADEFGGEKSVLFVRQGT